MTQTKPTEIEFVGANIAHVLGNNTFRRGDKYASLRPGDQIMGNAETGSGMLMVKAVYIGRLTELLVDFGPDNHGAKELQASNILASNEFAARGWVKDKLFECYDDVDVEETFTVIVFEAGFVEDDPLDEEVEEEDTETE